ncbi:hypothetical protein OS493_012403 [Desmophyllum pertusum]|uniref:Uncharacterized protein n=1 Tax=Desmophyllum pertusum TaxID=174260 RepID=A0A9X0D5X8_9CNID|nr:hypothetical protein OS493_012403 [Desmophyllum pertusum]
MSPTKKRLVNQHMKHKESMADRNYVLQVNAKRSAEAHNIMKDIIHGFGPGKESKDDKVVIASIFHDEITAGKLLTLFEVRAKMRLDLHLRILVPNQDKVKKIADLNVVHQTQLSNPTNDDDYDAYDINTIATSSSGRRRQGDVNDASVIEDKFMSTAKMPSKKDTLKMFDKDHVLSHILRKEGSTRCYEKVKSIFKKKAAGPA